MDIASPPRSEPRKICVLCDCSCDCVYLFSIYYLLHELCLTVNECMYAIFQFIVTYKVNCELDVLSIMHMSLLVLDSDRNSYSVK